MAFERIKKLLQHIEVQPQAQRRRDDPGNPDITLTGTIAVTYRCQCKCKHCGSAFYSVNESNELTLQELKDLISQCPAQGAGTLALFGGEPLVREDICEIIRHGRQLGLGTVMDTNAVALDDDMARRLAKAGLQMAIISLDSSDPKVHDFFRGVPGLFDKVMAAVAYCRKYGIVPRFGTTVDREKLNNGDFVRLLDLAEKINVQVRCALPSLAGRWNTREDIKFRPEEIKKYRAMLKPGKFFWEQEVCDSAEKNYICAAASRKMFYATAYGDITPCPYVPLSFGNVRRDSLVTILKRMFSHASLQAPKYTDCIMNDPAFREKYLGGFKTADSYPIMIDYQLDTGQSCPGVPILSGPQTS